MKQFVQNWDGWFSTVKKSLYCNSHRPLPHEGVGSGLKTVLCSVSTGI